MNIFIGVAALWQFARGANVKMAPLKSVRETGPSAAAEPAWETRTFAAVDVEARMTAILEAHLPALRSFAISLAGRTDLAEDIVQQTCLRAWIARIDYDASRPAKPWLFQIMKNEFLQNRRRKQPLSNIEDAALDETAPDEARPDQAIELVSLWRHLTMLPDDQRRALVLVIAMGLSYEEAALASQCEPGTMKSRVNRAKRRLRVAMGLEQPAIHSVDEAGEIAVGGEDELVGGLKVRGVSR